MAKLAERRLGPVGDYGTDTSAVDGSTLEEIELDGVAEEKERRLVTKFRRWFSDSYEASEEWRREAIKCREFVEGKQYDDADLQRLEDKGQATLVINKILGVVLFLEGLQRQQRRQPSLLPRESGDVRAAELMGGLVKWVGSRCKEAEIDSEVWRDKVVTGLGVWKVFVDFEDEPDGQVKWGRVDSLATFLDPNWITQGFDRMQYVLQADWLDMEQAIDQYPEHAEQIRRRFGEWTGGAGAANFGGSGSTAAPSQVEGEMAGDTSASRRQWWDAETQKVRVLEVWYVRRMSIEVAILHETGEVVDDEKVVSRLKRAVRAQPELAAEVTITKRPVKRVRMAKLLDTILLEDGESPYDKPRLPFFPSVAYLYGKRPFGVVKNLIDPQVERNVRRSRIMDSVRQMPTSGWLNSKQGGAKTEDIVNYATGDGVVINYDSVAPTKISPPELSQTLVYLEQKADADLKDVPNINAELQGQGTQRTVSGRAIEARQRGGLTTQEPLVERFQNDKIEATEFVVALIQQYVTPEKAMRVLGSIAQRAQLPNGVPMIGDQTAQLVQQSSLLELQQLLENAFLSEYDLEYTDVPWSPGEKFRRWELLSDLVERFGDWMPPKVIAEAARDAGIFTEAQAAETLAFIEKKLAMMQLGPGGAPPGAPQPGAPPQP